jgi:hypothetical protein
MADEENKQTEGTAQEQAPATDAVENTEPGAEEGEAEGGEEQTKEAEETAEPAPKKEAVGLSVFGFIGLGLIAWGIFSVFRHDPFWAVLGVFGWLSTRSRSRLRATFGRGRSRRRVGRLGGR